MCYWKEEFGKKIKLQIKDFREFGELKQIVWNHDPGFGDKELSLGTGFVTYYVYALEQIQITFLYLFVSSECKIHSCILQIRRNELDDLKCFSTSKSMILSPKLIVSY